MNVKEIIVKKTALVELKERDVAVLLYAVTGVLNYVSNGSNMTLDLKAAQKLLKELDNGNR